jgi:hypothetical protein
MELNTNEVAFLISEVNQIDGEDCVTKRFVVGDANTAADVLANLETTVRAVGGYPYYEIESVTVIDGVEDIDF